MEFFTVEDFIGTVVRNQHEAVIAANIALGHRLRALGNRVAPHSDRAELFAKHVTDALANGVLVDFKSTVATDETHRTIVMKLRVPADPVKRTPGVPLPKPKTTAFLEGLEE